MILATSDIHRASTIDQLKILGKRSGCALIIANRTASNPTSVIFDAIQIAKLKSADLLIIDTAGRLQNKINSMEELKKIVQVIKKIDPETPHETILIIGANIGQNSIHQVHTFNTTIKITGIIMTKLDDSAKRGILLSLQIVVQSQFDILELDNILKIYNHLNQKILSTLSVQNNPQAIIKYDLSNFINISKKYNI